MRLSLPGHGVSRGNALGRARVRLPHVLEVSEQRIDADAVDDELARLHTAIDTARTEMRALRDRLQGALAHEAGEFIELHTLLLDDPELLQGLDTLIRDGPFSADYALRLQRDRLAAVFEGMDDAYFRNRIDDIDQVIGRIHAALHRRTTELQGVAGDILVTDNVAPAELAQLQSQGVVAIVTAGGSNLSHSAILARSLQMPLVVGATQALQQVNDGDILIVDGGSGAVIVDPQPEDLRAYRTSQRETRRERRALQRLRKQPTRTRDGTDIRLYANVESRDDIAEAHALGVAGIGLYRTEFLFLNRPEPQRNSLPDEEEQFHAYRDALLGMSGRPVTIRTLDLGADKADSTGLGLGIEPNPALGMRGVRLSLARPDLFETQMRALVRASGYGTLRILVPMISTREEIMAVRALLQRVTRDLRSCGHEIADHIALGAMIEVPSAAITLRGFIDAVDFVSVGTNDLVQYLLAVDRNNDALDTLYSPLHPAVLRLLSDVIKVARARGKPVTVCGEMAAEPQFAPLLLALGLEDFSLHPATLLELRRTIRECDLGQLRTRAPALLRARDRAAIEKWLSVE